MNVRQLELKDAAFMLEWMHDIDVTHDMKKDFSAMTLQDAETFIKNSIEDDSRDVHMAIVSDKDEYMGTVSLKNITDGHAEFGIAMRSCAMGKGYSKFGMERILEIGFQKLQLKSIYWCVDPANKRAVRFYDKNGYQRVNYGALKLISRQVEYLPEEISRYIWYMVIE